MRGVHIIVDIDHAQQPMNDCRQAVLFGKQRALDGPGLCRLFTKPLRLPRVLEQWYMV